VRPLTRSDHSPALDWGLGRQLQHSNNLFKSTPLHAIPPFLTHHPSSPPSVSPHTPGRRLAGSRRVRQPGAAAAAHQRVQAAAGVSDAQRGAVHWGGQAPRVRGAQGAWVSCWAGAKGLGGGSRGGRAGPTAGWAATSSWEGPPSNTDTCTAHQHTHPPPPTPTIHRNRNRSSSAAPPPRSCSTARAPPTPRRRWSGSCSRTRWRRCTRPRGSPPCLR